MNARPALTKHDTSFGNSHPSDPRAIIVFRKDSTRIPDDLAGLSRVGDRLAQR